MFLKRLIEIICLAATILFAASCHHIDDDRLPPSPVHIAFETVGDWNVYGVAGAGTYRKFIKSDKEPQGFPYTALSYTGFGGILLIADVHGNPIAYDLACPVECRADVRVRIIASDLQAECPVCHSVYELITNYGHPLSGLAAERGYGLQRYYAGPGMTGEYMLISR